MRKTKQINISLPLGAIEEINALAELNQVTPSRAAAELVLAALERNSMELGVPRRRREL